MVAQELRLRSLCIATLGLLVFSLGCSRSQPRAKNQSQHDKWPEQSEETPEKYANMLAPPKYQLISDGDHLYLDYSGYKFDVVKGAPNPICTDIGPKGEVVIVNGGHKEVVQKENGSLMASVWSDKYQSLSFVTCFFSDDVSNGSGKNDRTRLWSWNRKNGLKLLLDWRGEMMAQDGSPREMRGSVDGEYLAFQFRKGSKLDGHDKFEVIVYSLGEQRALRYPVREDRFGYLDYCSILDSHTILVAGEHPKILDLKTGQSKPSALPNGIFPMTNFHGQMWALHFMNGKYDIVRVNSTLDKIEHTVEIPAKFPKPIRGPDYEDGGD